MTKDMRSLNGRAAPGGALTSYEELWRELAAVNWKRAPYYGLISRTGRELGMTQQGANNALRRRQLRFGIALLKNKRDLERRISDAYYGTEESDAQ